jgi:hypothetical protein
MSDARRRAHGAQTESAGLRVVDQIRLRAIAELKLNPRNTRKHSDDQVQKIAASIQQFGFTVPIMVDGDGVLIAGEGRLRAAQSLGMTEVPTIDGSYLTPEQRRAYVIADNKLALTSEWDWPLLQEELGALDLGGFDLGALGFSGEELEELRLDIGDESAASGGRGQRSRGGRDRAPGVVVQYNIVFDDDEQQQRWFAFLRQLKQHYPDTETIGARLVRWIEETGDG